MPIRRITVPSRRDIFLSAAAVMIAPSVLRATGARAAAPMLGPTTQTFHRFRLGLFEVTSLLDAGVMIDGPWPIVGENRPAADVEQLMRMNLLPEKRFRPGFTPTLVNTGTKLILFDAGNGEKGFVPPPDGGWLLKSLTDAGHRPEQVDLIVLTHAHPDHIGGIVVGGRAAFPNAHYVIGEAEYAFWRRDDALSADPSSNEYRSAVMFRSHVLPFADKMQFVKPGGEVAPGIRAVEAYGHTPGHLGFHVESEGKRLLIWGDCAHHEVASLAKPEWHAFFDQDKEKGASTRKKIYDMAAAEKLPVLGYHASFPSIGYVERRNSGYRWVPISYQLDT